MQDYTQGHREGARRREVPRPSILLTTLFIEPGSPWENGYVESFNGKLRDELLNREILYTLREAKVLVEQWRQEYNRFRPHSSLGYRPPTPESMEILLPESWKKEGFNRPAGGSVLIRF